MQRMTGRCIPMITVITSSVEGDEIIEQGKLASTAISTPPPRELLSLRKIENFVGRISKSEMESVSQVSVKQYTLQFEEYTND